MVALTSAIESGAGWRATGSGAPAAVAQRSSKQVSDSMTLQHQIRRHAETLSRSAKPHRISDLIPKNWDGSHDKRPVQEVHGRTAFVDASMVRPGLVGVQSVDKVDPSTLAMVCTGADFRTFDTLLYQVLHRTTTNEPLRMDQQVQGQRGFEAWHLIVRKFDQRSTSDRSSAYAALISKLSDRDRAKDAEQFDDILLINETNKYGGRLGNIRDEEKILAVKNDA